MIKVTKKWLGRARQLLVRNYHRFQMGLLRLRGLHALGANSTILFWVPGGMPMMLDVEGAIASAMELRGHKVHAIICDGVFRACIKREIKDSLPIEEWGQVCSSCSREARNVLQGMGVSYSFIGDYVDTTDRHRLRQQAENVTWESLHDLRFENVNVGSNARSAILRYLQGFDFDNNVALVREYAYSALITAAAAQQAMESHLASRIFMSHGVYAEWGPALRMAIAKHIPITAWMASYLKARFYFRHVEDESRIDFHNMSSAAWQEWKTKPLTQTEDSRLDDYVRQRYQKGVSFDMKRFKNYTGDIAVLRKKYGLIEDKPIWGVMAHINWDTVSDYSPMAYESFNAWIVDTVKVISRITDVYWILKVHPAESWDNPESGVERLVQEQYPDLASHVRIFGAEEEISPLEFYELVDGGVTVYGTAGLELAVLGKPVICAGEAHYGGKGFTHDGLTPEAYRELLQKAPTVGKLNIDTISLARRYAYTYFIRRQIPMAVVNDLSTRWWKFQFDKRKNLLQGNDHFVDFICARITNGQDFIMNDSLVNEIEQAEAARG